MRQFNPQHLARAVHALRAGAVIAYPTEGVWGLGCDPFNRIAVRRLLALKRRREEKGLILVAGHIDQVAPYLTRLQPGAYETVSSSWPGPVTWVVPVEAELPAWIRGRHRSVALRVSDHPQLRALCLGFGAAIVSTSANPQGRPPAMSALAVRRYFASGIDYLLPGELGGRRQPSQMREAISGRTLRPG